jgi:D-threo-aldose 1-dehydrogenase
MNHPAMASTSGSSRPPAGRADGRARSAHPPRLPSLPSLPSLAFGTAGIGRPHVPPRTAADTLRQAWDAGLRYFDTAPMYGSGRAERRLGRFLTGLPRDDYLLSTKVGRLVRPDGDGGAERRWVFDFSADAVRRSVDESLERLGVDRVDLLYLHDPDDHWREAIEQAWPALAELRDQGVVRAVGVGMNQAAMLTDFVREASPDVVLMAGQYSLLDRTALDALLPACQERDVAVVVAQALHGGLIDGVTGATFHYGPVDDETARRAAAIAAVCRAHGVPTAAAALRFPLGHPAVTTVLTGPETAAQLRQNARWARWPVPPGLWTDLVEAGLLTATAPVPTGPGAPGTLGGSPAPAGPEGPPIPADSDGPGVSGGPAVRGGSAESAGPAGAGASGGPAGAVTPGESAGSAGGAGPAVSGGSAGGAGPAGAAGAVSPGDPAGPAVWGGSAGGAGPAGAGASGGSAVDGGSGGLGAAGFGGVTS